MTKDRRRLNSAVSRADRLHASAARTLSCSLSMRACHSGLTSSNTNPPRADSDSAR